MMLQSTVRALTALALTFQSLIAALVIIPGLLKPSRRASMTLVRRFALPGERGAFPGESLRKISLSSIVSSPERYANSLNLSVADVVEKKAAHLEASAALHLLMRSSKSGPEKHASRCLHRRTYGRHPFACQRCWAYLPICVCNDALVATKRNLPSSIEVVVWIHHNEWGLTSNTGSLLALTLNPCLLLMKGLPEDDSWLHDKINDPAVDVYVLWPATERSDNREFDSPPPQESEAKKEKEKILVATLADLRAKVDRDNSGRRIIILAVDSTWRGARKMVARLPPSVPRLDLCTDEVFMQPPNCTAESECSGGVPPAARSILAPLRKRKGGMARDVCTAEAVVAALRGLGADPNLCEHTLSIVRQKVDMTARYRGKVDHLGSM